MKLLLIAYEFPPSPSPQSLRWSYLARELAKSGHEVHVLAPDLAPAAGVDEALAVSGIHVHRTWAGPIRGLVARARRRRLGSAAGAQAEGAAEATRRSRRSALKLAAVQLAYALSGWVRFPDVRGEWRKPATRALDALVESHAFDAMISSHEPATSIELALHVRETRSIPWLADLGDPVLAAYTPWRWRRRAFRLERRACDVADRVVVTAETAARLLTSRHAPASAPCIVTQGFAPRAATPIPPGGMLELVYAGSFYRFRRAEALLEAVAATPGVRLTIATVALPGTLRAIAERHPESFRLVGFVDHQEALELQARAHVLVNIANGDGAQIPGKLFEYLGAKRPILHLTQGGEDPGAQLVSRLRRGWVVPADREAIALHLADLAARRSSSQSLDGIDLSSESVASYAWPRLAERIEALLREISTGA